MNGNYAQCITFFILDINASATQHVIILLLIVDTQNHLMIINIYL